MRACGKRSVKETLEFQGTFEVKPIQSRTFLLNIQINDVWGVKQPHLSKGSKESGVRPSERPRLDIDEFGE